MCLGEYYGYKHSSADNGAVCGLRAIVGFIMLSICGLSLYVKVLLCVRNITNYLVALGFFSFAYDFGDYTGIWYLLGLFFRFLYFIFSCIFTSIWFFCSIFFLLAKGFLIFGLAGSVTALTVWTFLTKSNTL